MGRSRPNPRAERVIDFDTIYKTELVHTPDCWKLCGKAHCCNFRRVKSRFRLIGARLEQELPLLPGELDYLERVGRRTQFGDHHIRSTEVCAGARTFRFPKIVSRTTGCACEHATRPVTCRLRPMLPIVEVDGVICGLDRIGLYDVLEMVSGEDRICRIDSASPGELAKLRRLTGAITRSSAGTIALIAVKVVQDYVRARLCDMVARVPTSSVHSLFDLAL